jgi:hypothetical protein
MTEVVLGSNHFVDCANILAIRQHPLLRVSAEPLRISLTTPPDWSSARAIQVIDNRSEAPNSKLRIVQSETSVAVFWSEIPLVIATALGGNRVSLRADLRPLGINLYDDALGLHVGGNDFAGNQIVNSSTAIALG